jgi:hypothetical protein
MSGSRMSAREVSTTRAEPWWAVPAVSTLAAASVGTGPTAGSTAPGTAAQLDTAAATTAAASTAGLASARFAPTVLDRLVLLAVEPPTTLGCHCPVKRADHPERLTGSGSRKKVQDQAGDLAGPLEGDGPTRLDEQDIRRQVTQGGGKQGWPVAAVPDGDADGPEQGREGQVIDQQRVEQPAEQDRPGDSEDRHAVGVDRLGRMLVHRPLPCRDLVHPRRLLGNHRLPLRLRGPFGSTARCRPRGLLHGSMMR